VRMAVASGKGGTGKTTFATNLAVTAAVAGYDVRLLDCDVEEPDCRLFLWPGLEQEEPVTVPVPEVDEAVCNNCGVCARVCEFKAITVLPSSVLVFPELCHACGACSLLCPRGALTEVERPVGAIQHGRAGDISFTQGILDVGEARAVPVIKAVLEAADRESGYAAGRPGGEVGAELSITAAAPSRDRTLVVIDSPPGTSCPTIEACRTADLVVLVTEPTPFGLNDLRLAVEMVRALALPFVVVVNRSDAGDDRVRRYCEDEGIDVVAELPHDRRIAEAYSSGRLAVMAVPGMDETFRGIWDVVSSTLMGEHGKGPRGDGDERELHARPSVLPGGEPR
jgi:MinD superfamily P-loop ATPase